MTEKVETNLPTEQDGTNDRLYTEVKRLQALISDDGSKIPFTGNMKIVYAYLYTFQTSKSRKNYPEPIHPNMEVIAWENGISKPTAQKAVDALMLAGVLIKGQIQVRSGFKSNSYVVLKPSKVVARGVTPPHPNASKHSIAGESGKDEKKSDVLEPAAPVVEQTGSVSPVAAGDNADLFGSDDAVTGENVVGIPWIESPFDNGRLVPDARRWTQSKGAATWQEEIKLVWELKGAPNLEPGEHMRPDDEPIPVPEPAKQQVNGHTRCVDSPEEPDWDEDQPF